MNNVTRMYQPDELLDKFCDYVQWAKDNPIKRYSLIQKTGETVGIPLDRPLSHKAFVLHARISSTLYASYAKLPEYEEVVDIIKNSIYVNKYEGAAVGIFSSSIMIRDLGLSDNIIHTLDDSRKTISELFPSTEELKAINVHETDINYIDQLNSQSNDNTSNSIYQQELDIPNPNGTELIETGSSFGRIKPLRENDFIS